MSPQIQRVFFAALSQALSRQAEASSTHPSLTHAIQLLDGVL